MKQGQSAGILGTQDHLKINEPKPYSNNDSSEVSINSDYTR